MARTFDRRDVLKGTGALALTVAATPLSAQAPAATAVTDALIQAAMKEGKVVYYTSIDLPMAQRIGKAFETKYPGISVRVERSGAERVFQRIGQEYASNIHAVDVVNSSDAAHMIVWKRDGLLAPYVPEDVAKHYPQRSSRSGRDVCELPRHPEHHGLQHQSGEGRGGTEELCRFARSEMGRQDRQGASVLQRHDHDGDVPDRARSRLGVFREARQAENHAGAIGNRTAEEAGSWRARGDGRRQRVRASSR